MATSAVLVDTRQMDNATCPDFKVWPQNLKMVKKSRNLDLEKQKTRGERALMTACQCCEKSHIMV